MANVSQIEQCLKLVLEARASTLAHERGFIKRQRKWSRADLIRPRLSDRKAFEAIVYVLQTGIQLDGLATGTRGKLDEVGQPLAAFEAGPY
jgi:hypothetical protein